MWAVVVAAIVVAAGVGIVAGNVMGTRRADAKYVPQLTSAQQHVTRLSDDLDAARSTVSSYEAADASASAEAADMPDLLGIAHTFFDPDADVTGSESAVEITITDADVYRDSVALSLYLSELGFSSAVLDRMSKTRALDGTLTADGHKCNVSWTYHRTTACRWFSRPRPVANCSSARSPNRPPIWADDIPWPRLGALAAGGRARAAVDTVHRG